MMSASLLVTVVLVAPSTHCYPLINLDWPTLEREVTIRYFSPDKWASSQVGNRRFQQGEGARGTLGKLSKMDWRTLMMSLVL